MIREAINRVVGGENLSEAEAEQVMDEIMTGQASPAQIAALLTAMRLKGETVEEITGFARTMRRHATPVRSGHPVLVDTCGTGGDGANTFNISTAAALVLAGAGVPVAKHGNRSVSSRCGSADVLEALGVNLDLSPAAMAECLDRVGIAFLFAPALHKAMKHAAGPRREIGIRTVFNILGPLTNPAGASAQVVGVYSVDLVPRVARVLSRLGVRRAFVVHGAGGLDEISLAGPAVVAEVQGEEVREYTLDPADYGFSRYPVQALSGGTPEQNAAMIGEILQGMPGPQRDAVILNAALGLLAAGRAGDLSSALATAAGSIDSGAARDRLEHLVAFTRRAGRQVAGI
ncbi:anthranilate phosphoribosyltransferase [Desulfofundulus thermobenzoicus]|uniref:Anthranilate phosphoribosyltransferase n=1 Tax=Desulfofundulus thermobenzoicus TaxID=29376 RepID=A0A6N7INM0_9FIRM|nr:anthranilate phosphoribosyltransferase [Desulfofundulus thermobenzoicus]MQL51602.1 anthranilate phosphoribosyltransferase [Desulfofundulus thermobenzoicus]